MKIFKSKITMGIIAAILVLAFITGLDKLTEKNIHTVKSYQKLEGLYDDESFEERVVLSAISMVLNPFRGTDLLDDLLYYGKKSWGGYSSIGSSSDFLDVPSGSGISGVDSTDWWDKAAYFNSTGSSSLANNINTSSSDGSHLVAGEDYSTTNLQVENVDEADIIKTDGEYIYSISEYDIVVTDVRNPEKPTEAVRISKASDTAPEEFMISNNKLIVISSVTNNKTKRYSHNSGYNTLVEIYDLSDKANPRKIKTLDLKLDYYTSRIANDKLYVISSGYLRKDLNGKVIDYYTEDNSQIKIGYKNMFYFKDRPSDYETVISSLDLGTLDSKFNVQSYLVDVDNIYVSENNIYLEDEEYEDAGESVFGYVARLFGIKGIWSIYDDISGSSEKNASIFKIEMKKNGKVKYRARAEVPGTAVDQFSFDEYNSNLRVALEDDGGSRIVVFNNKLKVIGETERVEENENMYSSRFVGDKAYMVTYRTVDPLFVFDLSDPKKPKILGKLEIPGYSTYLHPYDENHIIGIGMDTEEIVTRNNQGKVVSTRAVLRGMKMALFDVSDMSNPKQISEVKIGDSKTRSAVLSNHKALLFSKERGIIAIPVNGFDEDLEEVTYYRDPDIDDLIANYNQKVNNSKYISEGYVVYNINLEEGITQKGLIVHTLDDKYTSSSNLIRGLYIKDNLFTISQHLLKVNKLDTLEEISSMEI